jgi:hypothetical protein
LIDRFHFSAPTATTKVKREKAGPSPRGGCPPAPPHADAADASARTPGGPGSAAGSPAVIKTELKDEAPNIKMENPGSNLQLNGQEALPDIDLKPKQEDLNNPFPGMFIIMLHWTPAKLYHKSI